MSRIIKHFALVIALPLLCHGVVYGQVQVELVALNLQSSGDVLPALPTSQTDFLAGDTFVLEVWAQTTDLRGLAQVSTDISFNPAVVNAVSVTHTALMNFFPCGDPPTDPVPCSGTGIDNVAGTIDNVSGSSLSPACVAQVGFAPNWGRVAIIQMTAVAGGPANLQSGSANDLIFVVSICGSLTPPTVTFGGASVTVSQCGNGLIEPLEQCDDSNTVGGDCCSAACQFEALSSPCEADGNLCTIDTCDGLGICATTSNVVCQAANPPCEAGQVCNSATGNCDNLPDAALGLSCEADASACTIDHCDGLGACVTFDNVICQPAAPPCEAGELCDPATGGFVAQMDAVAGTLCEADGSFCTFDRCDGLGACVTVSTVSCQPANPPCEGGELCDPLSGMCVAQTDAPLGTGCDADMNACTIDRCDGLGACVFNSDVVCQPASPPCEAGEVCNPANGVCDPQPDAPSGVGCDLDGTLCTIDLCDGFGACLFTGTNVICASAVPPCEAGEVCNAATGFCDPQPDAASGVGCDLDGTLCTIDQCDGFGACLSTGTNVVCQSPVPPCEAGEVCNAATGLCEAQPDAIAGTTCVFDTNVCTNDQCDGAGSCIAINNAAACDDGDACTTNDVCANGFCAGIDTSAVDCDDGDPCTADSCNPASGCVHLPLTGNACNDGDACTQTDTCQIGVCTGSNPVVCTALDQCHVVGLCDSATGVCSDPPIVDGTACDDGDACSQTDTCQLGACVGTNPVICTALDQCHVVGVCDSATGVCSDPPIADGTACDDGVACSAASTCIAGICEVGAPLCVDSCENCDVATDSCAWCQFDHNLSGVPDGFDFAFFSSCFGLLGVLPGEPCFATNYDRDMAGNIGTADFSLFSGCFAIPCAQCATCFGPVGGGPEPEVPDARAFTGVSVVLVPVRKPSPAGMTNFLPLSADGLAVDETFDLEVWVARSNRRGVIGVGLSSVYVDLAYDASLLTVEEIIPDATFELLARGAVDGSGLVTPNLLAPPPPTR